MRKIYLVIRYGKGKQVKGYILDIGMGGMSVASSKRIAKNTIIEIITKNNILPSLKGRNISIVDMKKKAYRYRLGVRFISQEKEKKESIHRFIHRMEHRKAVRLILI